MRKQIYDLTLSDLEHCSIWEFASDEEGIEGQDEATVRPAGPSIFDDPFAGQFVAKVRFSLADGTSMSGYLTPGVLGDDDITTLQPAIVTDQGQVSFWFGCVEPSKAYIESSYALLGKQSNEIFPLFFTLDVAEIVQEVAGTISGFMVMADWDPLNFRVIR